MMNLAAINLDALIPLIIGIFWVVAQIAGAAARKKPKPLRPKPLRPERPEEDTQDDPFADFMRRLGGVQEFNIPEPPGEPAETFLADEAPPPRSQEIQDEMPRLPETVPLPVLKPADVQEPDLRPSMRSFKTAMPLMKLPTIKLKFQSSEKRASDFPRVGKIINPADKQTLRRAMLSHIILGKPKGMEGWNTGRAD
jgi:hypothetical protein